MSQNFQQQINHRQGFSSELFATISLSLSPNATFLHPQLTFLSVFTVRYDLQSHVVEPVLQVGAVTGTGKYTHRKAASGI